jgi:putative transcriptional regulator
MVGFLPVIRSYLTAVVRASRGSAGKIGQVGRDLLPQRRVAGALSVLLALGILPAATPAADPNPLTAILITAQAPVRDPYFGDSVALVLNNLGPAPVGVVINRPTALTVAHLFPELKHLAQLHDRVYFGGPVDFGSVWFLFRAARQPEHAVRACNGVYLSASRELLLQLLARDKPMDGLRIFAGHAGWAPGQLEAEIARGDWKLSRAEPEVIFSGKPERPWPAPESPKDGA